MRERARVCLSVAMGAEDRTGRVFDSSVGDGCARDVLEAAARGHCVVFRITETVRFCYGHRLMEYVGKCARLHGHNARVELVLESASLDARGFVMDFDELEQSARRWVDDTLDHKLFLREDDPLVPVLEAQGEVFVKLPHNPTAEHFAALIFTHLKAQGLPIVKVRFWETDTSVAEYEPR